MPIIRPATFDDYEGLCAVILETDHFHDEALPHLFRRYQGAARPHVWLANVLADPGALLLVAENDGEIVGYLYGLVRETPDVPVLVPRKFLLVDMVGVKEALRGEGVGRALMAEAHRWACERGIRQAELKVYEFNERAIAFYESLGYTMMSRNMWIELE
jgi:diamine N-acetyltransferase